MNLCRDKRTFNLGFWWIYIVIVSMTTCHGHGDGESEQETLNQATSKEESHLVNVHTNNNNDHYTHTHSQDDDDDGESNPDPKKDLGHEQQDHHHLDIENHHQVHDGNGSYYHQQIKPLPGKVWAYGLACCTGVIILARMGVIILPLLRKDLYEKLIITMVGLAAGTLTGSSIFHLLPKAFSLEEKFEDSQYIRRCLVISVGIWAFLMIERLLILLLHHKERRLHYGRRWRLSNVLALPRRQDQNRVSVTSLAADDDADQNYQNKLNGLIVYPENSGKKIDRTDSLASSRPSSTIATAFCPACLAREVENGQMTLDDKYRFNSNQLQEQSSPPTIQFQEGSLSLVSTEAWMVLAGDCFLDFVDGLSIGTAFHDSILTGLSISIGILLEELPHELGEFAVLLNAGLPFRRALLFKFLASTTTYLGLGVGIWLGNIEASPYVFALAAGMFLYIALVDMVPELNQVALKSSHTSVVKGLRVLFLQNVGLIIGIAAIYLMAKNEHIFNNF